MKFRFPIVIIDEDFRSENASGFGVRALAKAIAYKQCGNREAEARQWARELVRLLEVADILKGEG